MHGSSAFTLKQLQWARKLVAGQCKENLTLVSGTKRGKRVRCSNGNHLQSSGFRYTEIHCFFICLFLCLFILHSVWPVAREGYQRGHQW